ncbi:MAG: HAD-IA family hydrolase [Luteitalea sp.]|nr:HAD-IA family hydrolase [Luteitalea sp.]
MDWMTHHIQGAVFDIDGTLLNNMPFHEEAFNAFATRYGLPALTLETRQWMDGKRNRDIFPHLFSREDMALEEAEALAAQKELIYRQLSQGRLSALAGLDRLLDLLDARGIPVALATSAPRANVDHTLRELGFGTRLALVARSDDAPRGKPFPDVFLAAGRLINVAPERCLAFEDAPAGIVAARAAGMVTIGVTTSYSRELLERTDPPPHAIVADYNEFLNEAGAWLTDVATPSRSLSGAGHESEKATEG